MKKNMNSRKGFTLVEMLGVLAIIAILISVIAVGVMSAINRARIVATVANFKNLETAVVGFVALPNSGGTVPYTTGGANAIETYKTTSPQGPGTPASSVNAEYTLDQVLRASGLVDRPMSWRVGADGLTQNPLNQENLFILSKNAWAEDGTVNGVAVPTTPNKWKDFNHCEVAKVNGTAGLATNAVHYDPDGAGVNFFLDGSSQLKASRVAYAVLKKVSLKDAIKLSQELNGSLDETEFNPEQQTKGRLVYKVAAPGDTTVDVYYYLASF